MAAIKSKQPKITPCLWFDKNALNAAEFYTSVFNKSKIIKIARNGEGGRMPKGTVLTVLFQIEEQKFLALNGGPYFKFSEAVSFIVNCKTQKEIDYFWEKLSKGGKKVQCGWLKDKFGLSWQIVPESIGELVAGKYPEKSKRAMQAMLKMKKLNIKELKRAYSGK